MSKKVSVFQEKINRDRGDTAELTDSTVMTKIGRQFFSGKIGVTPSVAAPGNTNPSDVTTTRSFYFFVVTRIRNRPNRLLQVCGAWNS